MVYDPLRYGVALLFSAAYGTSTMPWGCKKQRDLERVYLHHLESIGVPIGEGTPFHKENERSHPKDRLNKSWDLYLKHLARKETKDANSRGE